MVPIAITQYLLSHTTQNAQVLAELDALLRHYKLADRPSRCSGQHCSQQPPINTTNRKSSPALTFPRTGISQTVPKVGMSLRVAMALLFLSFSPQDIRTVPLPTSDFNSLALQEAFSRRPFAPTGADVSSLVLSLGNANPKSAMEVISAHVNDFVKEWAAKQVTT